VITTEQGAFRLTEATAGTIVRTAFAFGYARRVDTLEVPARTNVYVELVMPLLGGSSCNWPMIVRRPWWKFW
jgi:hypothetical protein